MNTLSHPHPLPTERCPKCGGLDWYQVGNLRCCFACAEGFIIEPGALVLHRLHVERLVHEYRLCDPNDPDAVPDPARLREAYLRDKLSQKKMAHHQNERYRRARMSGLPLSRIP